MTLGRSFHTLSATLLSVALLSAVSVVRAQTVAAERTYSVSADKIRAALNDIGAFNGQHLPILDGFVATDPTQVDQYQKPFFQYRIHVVPGPNGQTQVKVEAKITAQWTGDSSKGSQYRVLPSNGRLEADLLDQLSESLGMRVEPAPAALPAAGEVIARKTLQKMPAPVSAAIPRSPLPANNTPHPVRIGTPQEQLDQILAERQAVREKTAALRTELARLEGIAASGERVSQYVWIKRDGASMMSRMNFGGPVLFRAQEGDQFELISQQQSWSLVRLTHDATAWVQSDELEIPSDLAVKHEATVSEDVAQQPAKEESVAPLQVADATPQPVAARVESQGSAAPSSPAKPDLGFWVSREEVKAFSGDWPRLQGKKAMFVYVQPRGLLNEMLSDERKLAFAEQTFSSHYQAAGRAGARYEGVVVVFLGSRGGVAAATVADIREWSSGSLADDVFLSRCSLDPITEFRPWTRVVAGNPAGQ